MRHYCTLEVWIVTHINWDNQCIEPRTSQACERVILSAFHSMLLVKMSRTNFEVKSGICPQGRETWKMLNVFREKVTWNSIWFSYYNMWHKGCKRQCHILPPKKIPLTNDFTWKRVKCLCDPPYENKSIVESLHEILDQNV